MRHRKSGLQLNRNSSHRKALFRNLAIALIDHKIIKTTLPKAKELRRFIEPLITVAKEDSVAHRRLAYSRLNNKQAVGVLFSEIAKKSINRPGGYTRIIKAGYRAGDSAPMAYIELVDRELDTPLVFPQTQEQKESDQPSAPASSQETIQTEPKGKDFATSVAELETDSPSTSQQSAENRKDST